MEYSSGALNFADSRLGKRDECVTVKVECHCRSCRYFVAQRVNDRHDDQGQKSNRMRPFFSHNVVARWLDPLTRDTSPEAPHYGANNDYIAYFGDGWNDDWPNGDQVQRTPGSRATAPPAGSGPITTRTSRPARLESTAGSPIPTSATIGTSTAFRWRWTPVRTAVSTTGAPPSWECRHPGGR